MFIDEAKDITTLTMDELMGTLQTHGHQINISTTTFQEQSFKAQENSRGRGEEEMDLIEAQEAEVMEGMVKGMLVQKSQEEKATKRNKAPLKTTLEEVRRIITPTRAMFNATIFISMGIMQVNSRRTKVISQRKMLMWLM